MGGMVTPEAVRLDFADAGIGSRGVALMIDAIIVFVTLILISVGAGAAFGLTQVPGWVAVSTVLVLNFLVLFGYPIVCEVAFGGRSTGKMALGLRVVTREGAPVGFRHAAIRSAFMLVDFMLTLGAGAVISAALTRRSQRLGDLVAGTVVLRQRYAAGAPRIATFNVPEGAHAYAATISPTVLDPATYERIRAFLLRLPELRDDARRSVAVSLARPLLAATPPPPDDMDPVTYLRVLASVYQGGHAGPPVTVGSTGRQAPQREPPAPGPLRDRDGGRPRDGGPAGEGGFVAPE